MSKLERSYEAIEVSPDNFINKPKEFTGKELTDYEFEYISREIAAKRLSQIEEEADNSNVEYQKGGMVKWYYKNDWKIAWATISNDGKFQAFQIFNNEEVNNGN